MSNLPLGDDDGSDWRTSKYEKSAVSSGSPRSASTMNDASSSHSDFSYLSFRTEYSRRSGERQEKLTSMTLKKCQEALAARLSGSRRHNPPHTDVEQIKYPKGMTPKSSPMPYMRDYRRVPHQLPQNFYTGHASPHMAPNSAHHPAYYPAPRTSQHSAPRASQHSAPHTHQHAPQRTPQYTSQHTAPHTPQHAAQHPASSHRSDAGRRNISNMSASLASSSRLGQVMNPDGKAPLLISGVGSVRRAQSLLNNVPENKEVVGPHRLVIVYSTRKHAYFAIIKGKNGQWEQGIRCICATVNTLKRVALIEPAE